MNYTEGFAETYEQNFEINMEVDDDYDVRQRISRDELEGYDLNIHNVKACILCQCEFFECPADGDTR